MKKILSVCLVLALLLGAVCIFPASATYKGYNTKSGDFYYDILSDGTASIVYYAGTASHLTFPTEIDGIKVTEIDHPFSTYVFPYEPNTTVKSITVPEGILRCSLSGAPNLEELILPESLEEFCFAEGLRNSKIYKNPENWEDGVWYLGNRLLDVDEEKAPAKIKVKEGTKYISSRAFRNNDKLTEITFPDSLERIELRAFEDCESLSKINFNKNLKAIGDGAFYGCKKLTEIKLPQSLNTLESMAFYKCENLSKVSLPDNLQHIGSSTFENTAFYNNPENFEDGLLYYKDYLLDYSDDFKGTCNIKEGTKIVADPMFIVCDTVTSVIFPDNIQGIGDSFFSNCDNLEYVKLPAGIDTIYAETFRNCKKLKSLIIPEGVTEIDEDAFLNCDSLEYIELPSTIEKIAYYSIGYRPSSTPGHEDLDKRYSKNTKNLVIAGYKNTVAEVYAEMFGFEFVDISSQYKEKVLELLNHTEENPITHYLEIYRHFPSLAENEATPDYVLINAHTAEHGDAFAIERFGDYILRSDCHYSPATFGYLIYLPETNEVYSLEEAYKLGINNIEKVFTKGIVGELLGDVNYDRKLNIKDATLIQKAIAGISKIENNCIEGTGSSFDENMPAYISDFNCDGKMNIRDATAIQKHLAKLYNQII